MQIKTNIRVTDWLPQNVPHGYGCGYIGLPKEHPWYGMDYFSIPANVHGGLTWGDYNLPNQEPDGLYWIGFDTNHLNDDQFNCPKEYVESQVEALKKQALEAIQS